MSGPKECHRQGEIIGEVLNFDRDGKWHSKIEEGYESMKITMDSGAVDTVGPSEAAIGVEVQESYGSKNGLKYITATGQPTPNKGEKVVCGLIDDWRSLGIEMQVADVKKILGSVSKMCDAGNTVIFIKNGGKVINDVTGQETCIKREGGLYTITLWVPTNGKENDKKEDITKGTKPMGFVGLGSDMI